MFKQTYWNGTVDTNWQNSANWAGGVPASGDFIDISGLVSHFPVFSGTLSDNVVVLGANALLTGDFVFLTASTFEALDDLDTLYFDSLINVDSNSDIFSIGLWPNATPQLRVFTQYLDNHGLIAAGNAGTLVISSGSPFVTGMPSNNGVFSNDGNVYAFNGGTIRINNENITGNGSFTIDASTLGINKTNMSFLSTINLSDGATLSVAQSSSIGLSNKILLGATASGVPGDIISIDSTSSVGAPIAGFDSGDLIKFSWTRCDCDERGAIPNVF